MKLLYFFALIIFLTLNACSSVRESAGVTRKSIDEFQVVENPPLIIPPDFTLTPPDQLEEKNIDDIESELAEEILFGLDDNNIQTQTELSTMNQILSEVNTLDSSPFIREEIDREFSQELQAGEIFQDNWESEVQILDAIKESERIRNKRFEGDSIADGEIPTKSKKININKKKKKRFFFF